MDRATILETGIPLFFKAEINITASPEKIYNFISDAANHAAMDGSGMVKGQVNNNSKLFLGAKFGMKMRLGIPYRIKNEVIEYKVNQSIAWRHLLHNVWRYELVKIDNENTQVIESWDGRNARSKWWVNDAGTWVPKAMAKTLVNLRELTQK